MSWLQDANPAIEWKHKIVHFPDGTHIAAPRRRATTTLPQICNAQAFRQVARSTGCKLYAIKIDIANNTKDESPPDLPVDSRWQAVCREFQDVFEAPSGLPPARAIEHKIELLDPDATIPNHK